MKKKVSFALICACVMGFATSSCNNNEDVLGCNNNEDVLGQKPETLEEAKERGYSYTDYISDVNDESGVVCVDTFFGYTYIECVNGNRYYLWPETNLPEDGLTTLDRLENEGILVDGNNVKFSGKVYDTNELFFESQRYIVEYQLKDPQNASPYLPSIDQLPTPGHTFWLVAPNFTITKAE